MRLWLSVRPISSVAKTTSLASHDGYRPNRKPSLFHHEVDIGAAGAVGMQRVVVVPGPAGDERAVGLVWVHADDHLAPDGIAITERGIAVAHFVSRAVYRVKVHGGVHGGQLRGVLKMQRDGIVREFLDEVRLPVPLQSGRI